MSNGLVAEVIQVIHAPIERVWKALTDPADLARYMMGATVESDWQEGSPIVWKGEWKGKTFEDHGRVLQARAPELLKYVHTSGAGGSQADHTVTIELKESGGVTHLRLTQDNNGSDEERAHAEENWRSMLDGLKKMLGEAPVPRPEEPRN